MGQSHLHNRFIFYLGNLLIISSVTGMLFILYPIASVYLHSSQTDVPIAKQKDFFITIPKIHAAAVVLKNVDPWNEVVYKQALKKGVAHAKGTALPSEGGTIFLFAHSSGMPWELTRYNTIFLRLGELQKQDKINITYAGKEYTYRVEDKKEVWPQEVEYLLTNHKTQLVLQTCTPIGTSLKRLLIFALPAN